MKNILQKNKNLKNIFRRVSAGRAGAGCSPK
jgi:hypothetical protein